MTDPKGNSEFCFPETLNVEVVGKQYSLFPTGPVIKCFVIPPNSKIEDVNFCKDHRDKIEVPDPLGVAEI